MKSTLATLMVTGGPNPPPLSTTNSCSQTHHPTKKPKTINPNTKNPDFTSNYIQIHLLHKQIPLVTNHKLIKVDMVSSSHQHFLTMTYGFGQFAWWEQGGFGPPVTDGVACGDFMVGASGFQLRFGNFVYFRLEIFYQAVLSVN